ncbi:MAG: polymer-forming cytoskeletal protein [Candidatus Saganbacteria bacterium]|nr:polymer-forming cytoskeletal protein [Candidatus Saganbacteria bacterium]
MKFWKPIFLCLALIMTLSVSASIASAANNEITKIGSDVFIAKDVSVDKVSVIGGSAKIDGQIQGDVAAIGGSVILGDTATVLGDVVAIGGTVQKAPNTIIKGDIVEIAIPGHQAVVGAMNKGELPLLGISIAIFCLLAFVCALILALVVVGFYTKQIGNASFACEKSAWRCFWAGVLGLILIVPITLLLLISLIGIVFIPLWIMLVVAALFFGKVVMSQLIGKKLLHFFKVAKKPMMLEVAFGIIVLAFISMIPFIGGLIKMILITIALGGVILTRFGAEKA